MKKSFWRNFIQHFFIAIIALMITLMLAYAMFIEQAYPEHLVFFGTE